MSRSYNMSVNVSEFDLSRVDKIQDAANDEWSFLDWFTAKDQKTNKVIELSASEDGNLCGGETEEEFSHRLARAIFKANGKPCKVQVSCIFLEDLPCDNYTFDENDADLMKE